MARPYDSKMPMFYVYGGPHWLGWLVGLLVLGAIITTVVLVARSSRRQAVTPQPWSGGPWPAHWQGGWQSPGLHELDIRYARGEISREEYLQRRADIASQPGTPPGGSPPASSGPSAPA